jgi:hypothetical protein
MADLGLILGNRNVGPAGARHIARDYMGEHWIASFAVLAFDDED